MTARLVGPAVREAQSAGGHRRGRRRHPARPVAARPPRARGCRRWLLPPDAAPILGVIAQLGVILYMFLVGLELDLGLLRSTRRRSPSRSRWRASSCRSRWAPACRWRSSSRSRRQVCRSRRSCCSSASRCRSPRSRCWRASCGDRGLQQTRLGTLALTCAAINDAIAWCLLAFVVSVMQATPAAAIRTVAC